MPSNKIALISGCLVVLLFAGCGDGGIDKHPGQPVKNRQALFNQMLQAKDAMGAMMREHGSYEGSTFLAQARELQRLAREPWQYFTPGSNYAPTRAKPLVWDQPEEFGAARHDLEEATALLAKAAADGDLKAVRANFKEVEIACKSCHNKFRNRIPLR